MELINLPSYARWKDYERKEQDHIEGEAWRMDIRKDESQGIY